MMGVMGHEMFPSSIASARLALNAAGDLIVREVYIWTLVKLDTGRAKSGEKTGPVLHNRQEDHESFLRHYTHHHFPDKV